MAGNIEHLTGDALCACGHPRSAHRLDHDEVLGSEHREFCAPCDAKGWPRHCDGFVRREEALEQIIVRDWLVKHSFGCPRCGGANQGYSTWIIRKGEVACDNCFFPASDFTPDEQS